MGPELPPSYDPWGSEALKEEAKENPWESEALKEESKEKPEGWYSLTQQYSPPRIPYFPA